MRLGWLDAYGAVEYRPIKEFVDALRFDLAKSPLPVAAPEKFNFRKWGLLRWDEATAKSKQSKYIGATTSVSPKELREFIQHLLLGPRFKLAPRLGETVGGKVDARKILERYASEPDANMDKGLDASWHQSLMGGTDVNVTSSQGFRHMSFLYNFLGEPGDRAQLFYDLALKAFKLGFPYWGFRFLAWTFHYVEDLTMPFHAAMIPSLSLIRIKGTLFGNDPGAGGADPAALTANDISFDPAGGSAVGANETAIATAVKAQKNGFGKMKEVYIRINSNYHSLVERWLDEVFVYDRCKRGANADRACLKIMSAPVGDEGDIGEWPGLRLGGYVREVALERADDARSDAGDFAKAAIVFFTKKFMTPPPGKPLTEIEGVQDAGGNAVPMGAFYDRLGNNVDADARLRGVPKDTTESYAKRMEALATIWRIANGEFKRAGQAVRRVMKEVKKALGK